MQRRNLYILSGIATIFVCGAALKAAETTLSIHSSATVKIPSPEEISKLADSYSAEELSQLEIDDVLRDRLRFDPQWQEIAQAVRQDIIIAKWGAEPVKEFAWKRYGAKAYPLLSYYSRSRDRTRQQYGIEGIRSLGKPFTTIWLRGQIQRRLNHLDFDQVAPYGSSGQDKQWEKDFGLDDPQVRAELIKLAKANLEPKNSPDYYRQFNLDFLTRLLGYEEVYGKNNYGRSPNLAGLPKWAEFESLANPSDRQISEAVALYETLSSDAKDEILVKRLGAIKAGEISNFGRAFFRSLANNPKAADRVWAIAELDRHNDPQGKELLQQILNTDLAQLYPLSKIVSYENFGTRGDFAYYLLLGMVEKYPQSKFAQACREYGDLTGRSYFNGEPRSDAILARNAKLTAQEKVQAWQTWLKNYGDHAGADDTHYFLARALQDQNDVMGAMRIWIKLMANPMGDRDAVHLAFPHVRTLLDVGLSIEQMQSLLKEPESQLLVPLLKYAIAVQYARSQNYEQALVTAAQVNLTDLPNRLLEEYYNPQGVWREGDERAANFKNEARSLLAEQKQRWQQLRQWQIENTPISRYQIAAKWTNIGGWKNGYLPIWGGGRAYFLPSDWDCDRWWVCDASKRSQEEILAKYQGGSQNAIALSLYQDLLADPQLPPNLREKSLYMVGMTLLEQWENHTYSETQSIHPPAGVANSGRYRQVVNPPNRNRSYSYQDDQLREREIMSDYQSRIDGIITELQVKFPNSSYIDDLLFSSFFLSDQIKYLKQLTERYPNSDRASEAKFLLQLKTKN